MLLTVNRMNKLNDGYITDLVSLPSLLDSFVCLLQNLFLYASLDFFYLCTLHVPSKKYKILFHVSIFVIIIIRLYLN